MFFSGQKERQRRRSRLQEPAAQKKILNDWGERSESPVAFPTAPARLIKPECAADPAAGDLPHGRRRPLTP
jgi:hypothetical protein